MFKLMRNLVANRKIRFAVIGMFNTLFGLLMFFSIGLLVPTTAIVNLLLAYVPSTLVGFLTQKHLVWQTSATASREFPKFLTLTVVQAALNVLLLWAAVYVLGHNMFIAQTFITGLQAVIAYLLSRNWVFQTPAK
jgi:putative flippase GtrA